jgi:hypothetical protein
MQWDIYGVFLIVFFHLYILRRKWLQNNPKVSFILIKSPPRVLEYVVDCFMEYALRCFDTNCLSILSLKQWNPIVSNNLPSSGSVHRVFWNMQWDMLGLASTAMLWATLWLIEGVLLTVFLEIGEASGHSN